MAHLTSGDHGLWLRIVALSLLRFHWWFLFFQVVWGTRGIRISACTQKKTRSSLWFPMFRRSQNWLVWGSVCHIKFEFD